MSIMMQNFYGNDDILNRLTSSEVIYSELQRTFVKSKGKEDRNKFLKLVVSFVNVVSPVSEKELNLVYASDKNMCCFSVECA